MPQRWKLAGSWLRETQKVELAAVGHRVVHGGPQYDRPVVINKEVLTRLEGSVALAPLHQPNNLAPIRRLMQRQPPNLSRSRASTRRFIADTHRSRTITQFQNDFYNEGVRRYGFHGLSYEYIAGRLHELAPTIANGRVIVAHLGSGASMCALGNGTKR